MRELKEEMKFDIKVNNDNYFLTVNHTYPDFSITMYSFICKGNTMKFERKEHIDHKWLKVKELMNLDWADADKPIVEELVKGEMQ